MASVHRYVRNVALWLAAPQYVAQAARLAD